MSDMDLRRNTLAGVKRVVVKIGSGVLTHHSEIIDLDIIESIVSDLSVFIDDGGEVIIVTSGAVSAGLKKLGLRGRPNGIPEKQAAAAAGQSRLDSRPPGRTWVWRRWPFPGRCAPRAAVRRRGGHLSTRRAPAAQTSTVA